MTADVDLPVWSIRPNWSKGITERLSWLTDVLPSTNGTEQRRALRLSPRRSFEMDFNAVDGSRTFLDLWLHRFGSAQFTVPLWHDNAELTAAIAAGATVLPVDTTYREFVEGGLALIVGPDAFTCDKVEVVTVAADSITVAAGGVTRAWAAGTSIHPLRRCMLTKDSVQSALSSRVGSATLEFQLNQANDIDDEGTWTTLYNETPVLLEEPNWREKVELTFQRNSDELDNEHGLTTVVDDAGRAFTLQTHGLMAFGRAEQFALRQMLYRLRGRAAPVILPTFNKDIELYSDATAADAFIDIRPIGYAYTGGPIAGRTLIVLNGAVHEITGATAFANYERLTLGAALGEDMPAGSTGSFADTCRLASDDVEIAHAADSDGAAEVNISFKSFLDERVEDPVIDSPIAEATKTTDLCGSPGEMLCVPDWSDDPDSGGGGGGTSNGIDGDGPFYMGFRYDYPTANNIGGPLPFEDSQEGLFPYFDNEWEWRFIAADAGGNGGRWKVSGVHQMQVRYLHAHAPDDSLPDVETFTATATLLAGANPDGVVVNCEVTYDAGGFTVIVSSDAHLALGVSSDDTIFIQGYGGSAWETYQGAPTALPGKPALNPAFWGINYYGDGIFASAGGYTFTVIDGVAGLFNPELY